MTVYEAVKCVIEALSPDAIYVARGADATVKESLIQQHKWPVFDYNVHRSYEDAPIGSVFICSDEDVSTPFLLTTASTHPLHVYIFICSKQGSISKSQHKNLYMVNSKTSAITSYNTILL